MHDPGRLVDRRTVRRRRWIAGAALVLAASVVVVVALVVSSRLDAWTRAELERRLGLALGGEVRIGRLEVNVPRLEVVFADVEIRAGDSGGSLGGEVDSGRLRLAWRGLAALPAGRLRLSELLVEGAQLSVDQRYLDERARARQGEVRSIDLRIDRLEITGGKVRYEDVEIPVNVEVHNLDARGAWGLYRRAMIGQATFDLAVEHPVFGRPYPVRVSTGVRLRGTRIDFLGVTAGGPGLELSLVEGRVALETGLPLSARGRAVAELDRLDGWLAESMPEIGGRLEGEVFIDRGPGPIHVGGNAQARESTFGLLRASRARARFDYWPGEIELSGLEAAAYGGDIRGAVHVDLVRPTRFRADLSGQGMDGRSLFELVGSPLPVASRTAVTLGLEGEADDLATWSGEGRFEAVPKAAGPGQVPAGMSGSFALSAGGLRVDSARVEAAGAELTLSLEMEVSEPRRGVMSAEGDTISAEDTRAGVVLLLESMAVDVPEVLRTTLAGRGKLRTRIGLGGATDLEVGLSLVEGAWAEQKFDRGELELRLDDGGLAVRRLAVAGPDWDLGMSSRLEQRPGWELTSLDGEATDVPVAALASFLGGSFGADGRLSGQAALNEGPRGLEGSGHAEVHDARYGGERIGEVRADFSVRRNVLDLYEVVVDGPGFQTRGETLVDLSSGIFEGTVTSGRADLSALDLIGRRGIDAGGDVSFSGPFRYTAEGLVGEVRMSGSDWRIAGFELGVMSGELSFDPAGLDFQIATGRQHGVSLEGHLAWSAALPVTSILHLDRALVELGIGTRGPVWARLSGHMVVEGPVTAPEDLNADGTLEAVELHLGTRVLRNREPASLRLGERQFVVGPVRFEGTESDFELSGRYGLVDRSVEGTCKGTLGLGAIAAVWPELRATGVLDVNLSVGGTLPEPDLGGSVRLDGGRVRILGFPEPLDDVDLAIRIEGQEARLEHLRARIGGGEIVGAGAADFQGLTLDTYRLDLDIANARVRYPEGFKAAYEGHLEVRGDPEGSVLSGDLDLLRGVYDREFDLPELLGYGVREYASSAGVGLPVRVFLDVGVRAEDNVWVRNEMADLEVRLDLHFGGDLDRPEITGRVWVLEDGEIRFRDVEYKIRSGSLDLLELQRINPYVEIRADTTVRDYDVFLHVQGTLDKLEYELTSDPVLSPQDIIALLTTGRTLETLATAEGDSTSRFTGDVVANYFASALTQPFERQLQKLLGLEQVRIDPLLVQGQADPSTRITLGKRAAENLFVTYSTDLGSAEENLYQVEWKASRKVRLIAERSASGGVGSDIRYSTRFWFDPPDADDTMASRERAVPASERSLPTGGERVGGVTIEGADETGLAERISVKAGVPYSRSLLLEGAQEIRRYYVRQGRIEARVEAEATPPPVPGGGTIIVYRVRPGPRVKVEFGELRRKDERKLRSGLQTLWLDSVFQEELYQEAMDLILRYFHRRGYYTADVSQTQELRDGARTVRFRVDPGDPVRVDAVHLDGVEGIPEEKIRRQMLTRPSTVFSRNPLVPETLDEDVAAIRNLYREHGFLDVAVGDPLIRLSSTGSTAEVTLKIDEGPVFRVGSVDAPEGLPFTPDELVKWTGLAVGETFSPGRLLEAEGALRVQLDGRGHSEARVGARLEILDDEVHVHLEVDAGELKRVGEVEITGNRKTKTHVIRRELLLKPGDLISRDGLLRTQHRLYKMGIFRNVRVSFAAMGGADPTLHRVKVEVEESPPVGVVVGAGYNSEDRVRGTFSLSHANPTGHNRGVAFQGRASAIEKRLEWVFLDPRLFGRRSLAGLLNVFWQNREEVAFTEDRRSVAVRATKKIGDRWTHFVRYGFQKVDLTDVADTVAVLEQKLENLKLGNAGYGVVRNTRDDLFNPTRGGYASADVRVFAPALLSDSSFTKVFLQGSTVHTFRNDTQLASAARLGAAWPFGMTSDIPLSERFFAGGDSTLRGFPRDRVGPRDPVTGLPTGGEALFLLNEEWRFPIWRVLRGTVFYDVGNVYAHVGDVDLTDLRHVLGFGLRLETPLGPFRVEYGRKLDRQAGESGGELFVAIGAAF